MKIDTVQSVQDLEMLLDENYTGMNMSTRVMHLLLSKYVGIFNHITNFVSVKIVSQLYFAFVYSRYQYSVQT